MKIIVASQNPIKIAAVRRGFEKMLPSLAPFDIQGVSVSSGVRDQPMTFDETLRGAKKQSRKCHG